MRKTLFSRSRAIEFFAIALLIVNCQSIIKSEEHQITSLMKTYVFCEEVFEHDYPGSAEREVYRLLKEKPLKKPLNYLAAPLNKLDNSNMLDNLPTIRIDGGFSVVSNIALNRKNRIFSKLKEIGIDCVFTYGASLSEVEYLGIHIEPLPYIPINGVEPSTTKNIFYSFIGQAGYPCRKAIFSIKHPANAVVKKRPSFFLYNQNNQKFEPMKNEFKDVLSRSRFSLCPRGQQPNSYRFWESLQAGAIPVLISDEARLPEWFDWSSCVVRVAEKDVKKIPQILEKISPEKEEAMRACCLKAHKLFSGENLVSVIRMYYHDIDIIANE